MDVDSPAGNSSATALVVREASEKEGGAATTIVETPQALVVGGQGTERGEAGGGGSALDEGVFPWYVVGLKNHGAAPQARWLISRHSLFV